MKTQQLTNEQLVLLAHNKAHNSFIRKSALTELESRNSYSTEHHQELLDPHQSKTDRSRSLPLSIKIMLLAGAPLFSTHIVLLSVQSVLNAYIRDRNYLTMQKQYWRLIMISYLLWTVIIVAWGKSHFK